MMIKAAGCVLIIYASCMAGRAVGQLHVRMLREMSELMLFICMIKGQLAYAGPELAEIMSDCENRLHGSVRTWVHSITVLMESCGDKPFAELWDRSLVKLSEESVLRPEMIAEAGRIGAVLGDMDVDAQLARLAIIEGVIRDSYNAENAKSEGIRRLSSSLGLLGGLFIVLVLV